MVTQVVEDARPLLLRAIELADQVHPAQSVMPIATGTVT